MSTEKTRPPNAPGQPVKPGLTGGNPAYAEKPAIQKIEVTSLQLDESYDVDCDPYNCTGQFLVDAAKLRNGE
jgi:hypothetical protein